MNCDLSKTIILYPNTNHFYKFIGRKLSFSEYPVQAFGLYRFRTKIGINFVRALELFKGNCAAFTFGKWKREKNADMVIVFDLVGFIDVMKLVDQNHPKARKILYLWNIKINPDRVEYALGHGWEIWSFDKKESHEMGWHFNSQFYPYVPNRKHGKRERYDFFWCGYDKGRAEQLNTLNKLFIENGFSYKMIVKSWGIKNYKLLRQRQPIGKYATLLTTPYPKILQYVEQSRCVIDIVRKGQIGITMHALEAVSHGKKLLTNNVSYLTEPFYSPNNVFIIGKDDLENLKRFMELEIDHTIYEDAISQYSVQGWYQRFFENDVSIV